jgi:hypothetical protein
MKKIEAYTITAIELLGMIVLVFVLLAIAAVNVPWSQISAQVYYAHQILVAAIIASFTLSLVWLTTRSQPSPKTSLALGIILIAVGAAAVFFVPEYFHTMYAVALPYWFRVSLYSLPAICIEGGMFNLFRGYLSSRKGMHTVREHRLLLAMFIVYATVEVVTNFQAINGTILVSIQITLLRVIVAIVMVTCLVIALERFRKKRIR